MASPVAIASCKDELVAKVRNRTARIGIIGLGYVGLPLALLFREELFPVSGFDIDTEKIGILNRGGSYIHRIPPSDIQIALGRIKRSLKFD